MLIICPNCASTYLVRSSDIGPAGRIVRCGICRTSWQINAEATAEPEAAPESSEPGAKQRKKDGAGLWAKLMSLRFRATSRMAATLALAFGLAAFGVTFFPDRIDHWGKIVSDYLPFAIKGPTLSNLALDQVTSRLQSENDVKILMVLGHIQSWSDREQPLPGLEFVVLDERHQILAQWSIPAPVATIASRNAVPFSSTLASPPPGGKELLIRLIDTGTEGGGKA